MISEAKLNNIFPIIAIGNVYDMCLRHIKDGKKILYEGEGGNLFPVIDNKGNIWMLWIFRYFTGKWCYQMDREIDQRLKYDDTYIWLSPKQQK